MFSKIRPNAVIFGVILAVLFVFLIQTDDLPKEVVLVSVGIVLGSLGTGLTKVLDDPPPPQVPGSIVEKILDKDKE